jgi:hypothetical protein
MRASSKIFRFLFARLVLLEHLDQLIVAVLGFGQGQIARRFAFTPANDQTSSLETALILELDEISLDEGQVAVYLSGRGCTRGEVEGKDTGSLEKETRRGGKSRLDSKERRRHGGRYSQGSGDRAISDEMEGVLRRSRRGMQVASRLPTDDHTRVILQGGYEYFLSLSAV